MPDRVAPPVSDAACIAALPKHVGVELRCQRQALSSPPIFLRESRVCRETARNVGQRCATAVEFSYPVRQSVLNQGAVVEGSVQSGDQFAGAGCFARQIPCRTGVDDHAVDRAVGIKFAAIGNREVDAPELPTCSMAEAILTQSPLAVFPVAVDHILIRDEQAEGFAGSCADPRR